MLNSLPDREGYVMPLVSIVAASCPCGDVGALLTRERHIQKRRRDMEKGILATKDVDMVQYLSKERKKTEVEQR